MQLEEFTSHWQKLVLMSGKLIRKGDKEDKVKWSNSEKSKQSNTRKQKKEDRDPGKGCNQQH